MIENIKFKKRFRGYNTEEVDGLIQKIIQEYNDGSAQNERLLAELRNLNALKEDNIKKLNEWETAYNRLQQDNTKLHQSLNQVDASAREQAAGQVMVDAELFAVRKTAAAKAEADQIVGKARREADKIIKEANTQLAHTRAIRNKIIANLTSSLKSIMPDSEIEVTGPDSNLTDMQHYRAVSEK